MLTIAPSAGPSGFVRFASVTAALLGAYLLVLLLQFGVEPSEFRGNRIFALGSVAGIAFALSYGLWQRRTWAWWGTLLYFGPWMLSIIVGVSQNTLSAREAGMPRPTASFVGLLWYLPLVITIVGLLRQSTRKEFRARAG